MQHFEKRPTCRCGEPCFYAFAITSARTGYFDLRFYCEKCVDDQHEGYVAHKNHTVSEPQFIKDWHILYWMDTEEYCPGSPDGDHKTHYGLVSYDGGAVPGIKCSHCSYAEC